MVGALVTFSVGTLSGPLIEQEEALPNSSAFVPAGPSASGKERQVPEVPVPSGQKGSTSPGADQCGSDGLDDPAFAVSYEARRLSEYS